jgi:hypothetical protein
MILRTATKVLHHSMLHGAWKDTLLGGYAAPKHRLVPFRCAFGVMVKPDALGSGESQNTMPRGFSPSG